MRRLPNIITGALVGFAVSTPAWAAHKGETPDPTEAWNHTWNEVLVDLWVIGILFGAAAIYMLLKYRAKSPDDVGEAKQLTLGQSLAWCLVPAALFLADDFLLSAKGWSLWNIQRTVPANAIEIKVTASQWAFAYEYPNGVEISSTDRDTEADLFSKDVMDGDMVVPVGQPIVFAHGLDRRHSLFRSDRLPAQRGHDARAGHLFVVHRQRAEGLSGCVRGILRNEPFTDVQQGRRCSTGRIRRLDGAKTARSLT